MIGLAPILWIAVKIAFAQRLSLAVSTVMITFSPALTNIWSSTRTRAASSTCDDGKQFIRQSSRVWLRRPGRAHVTPKGQPTARAVDASELCKTQYIRSYQRFHEGL